MTLENAAAWAGLAAVVALLAWLTRRDIAEYAAFKALTDTRDRQRVFLRWAFRSFLLFGAGGMFGLAALGEIDAFYSVPHAFQGLAQSESLNADISPDFLIGFVPVVFVIALVGGIIARRRSDKMAVVGDVEALMPRNGAERWCAALLSLNAGFSEEAAFRLFLPVLVNAATGEPLLALGASALLFGAAHAYQGWAGVVVTTMVGGGFSFIYLMTGSIWAPIALHAAMDLNALVLQPLLRDAFARRAE